MKITISPGNADPSRRSARSFAEILGIIKARRDCEKWRRNGTSGRELSLEAGAACNHCASLWVHVMDSSECRRGSATDV